MRILLILFAIPLLGAELSQEQVEFFENKIRPALVDHCYRCHSRDEQIKGGLNLDSKLGWEHGGDSGESIIVPGNADASLLWSAITWDDPDYEMPPKRKMPDSVLADFRKWIEMGAPDPRVSDSVVVENNIDIEKGKEFWAFQPAHEPKVPRNRNADWGNNAIDRFVVAKLESEGLKPVSDASPEVLLRRLHFDLVGLPPKPEEVAAFKKAAANDLDAAIASKVDVLLRSPQFGERWGRHWLDVARYAESSGKESNHTYPHAWRYRDYVIDAFNSDKPYDEFIREQIAGDLLPAKTDAEWQEHLIATGFLALGTKGLNERSARQFALDVVDEQIDTTMQAVLGLTVACARCHDHKSDPIPTVDYYALAGIFMSTDSYYGTVDSPVSQRGGELLLLPVPDEEPIDTISAGQMAALKRRYDEAEAEYEELLSSGFRRLEGNDQQKRLRLRGTLLLTKGKLNRYDDEGNAKSFCMGVQDRKSPSNATVLIRGDRERPAQKVNRGYLQVLDYPAPAIPAKSSGRRELATWITSEDNPLFARVMANRVWQELMGRGIVGTPNNFGQSGQRPTHPELLDYLAMRLMKGGWSIKHLVRGIVSSRVYQLSSEYNAKAYDKDPDNTWFWRADPRQLDAEALRDAMLAVSGGLDLQRPFGSAVARLGDTVIGRRANPDTSQIATYRSVYLPTLRDAQHESLALFNGADPSTVVGVRESTNVPGQALYLMNNPFVIQQSEAMATQLIREHRTNRERLQHAFLLAYGRKATSEEVATCLRFFADFHPQAKAKTASAEAAGFLTFSTFCQGLLASAEFRFLN
ncbi:MAG: hypothetical protein ACI8W8_000683 [Rhodothermales bacterium]|jgi:hypothetical protein